MTDLDGERLKTSFPGATQICGPAKIANLPTGHSLPSVALNQRMSVNQTQTPTATAPEEILIYVVDDEEPLLELVELSLLDEGYALKKFLSPLDAWAAFQQEPRKPCVLVTDFAMGGMNGLQLSQKCKSSHPGLKVLMVSGNAGAEIIFREPGQVDEFISKPYQPKHLAERVRALVQSRSAPPQG